MEKDHLREHQNQNVRISYMDGYGVYIDMHVQFLCDQTMPNALCISVL